MPNRTRHLAFAGAATLLLALTAACSDGTAPNTSHRPDYIAVAAGRDFTCALTSDQQTYCWGDNDSVPVALDTPEPLVRVTAAGKQLCGIGGSGLAYCWGWMRCCYDTGIGYGRPAVAMADSLRFLNLWASDWHVCGLTTDSLAVCWGDYNAGKRGQGPGWTPPPDFYGGVGNTADLNANAVVGALKFRALAAGGHHTCGVLEDGQIACWGDSTLVGNPGATFSHGRSFCGLSWADACVAQPVLGPTLTGASLLAAGDRHTCVLASQGLRCWGFNGALQLGVATVTPGVPSLITLPGSVTSLTAAGDRTCATLESGAAWCWGASYVDQSGDRVYQVTLPTHVPFDGKFVAISTGDLHTCAITATGRLFCWGSNGDGRLGNGSTNDSPVPVEVAPPRS